MGKIIEKKKKKKGRPSLLDLQKRSIKQQQDEFNKFQKNPIFQNPNPNSSSRRSTRRNPNPSSDPPSDDDDSLSNGKKKGKKLKLVSKLPGHQNGSGHSGSGSDPDDEILSGSNLKKRKIDSIVPGSGNSDKGEKHSASTNQASIQQESKVEDETSTLLPDIKLLLFILERLQKKDTYGVFADPVDPEELPDYFEVVEHPMDFTTVRKKLTEGAYGSLEQFEKDVFLICSNAMQYNAPDTIYFRQARSIQELAMKNFENLRQDSDDNEPEPDPEPEPKPVLEPKVVRRGRPPTKNIKRPPGRPPLERASSNFSEATLATSGANTNKSNNDRKGPTLLEQKGSPELFKRSAHGLRYGEAYSGRSAEKNERFEDMTGSASKGMSMKFGKKNIVFDDNRRNTYKQASALSREPSVLTTFDDERKLLIPVGLHSEYGYARSLSRFAAKLGPVTWKVASAKINKCLPAGVKFGQGWVGETEGPAETVTEPSPPASAPTQAMVESHSDVSEQKPQGEQSSAVPTPLSCQSKSDDKSIKAAISSPPIIPSDCDVPKSSAPLTIPNPYTSLNGHSNQIHHIQSRINGLNGSYGLNFAAQMSKMVGATRPGGPNHQPGPSVGPPSGDNNGCGEAKSSENTGTTIIPNESLQHPKVGSVPPDLNVGFQSTGSPGSGRSDSVQPDLALQL